MFTFEHRYFIDNVIKTNISFVSYSLLSIILAVPLTVVVSVSVKTKMDNTRDGCSCFDEDGLSHYKRTH